MATLVPVKVIAGIKTGQVAEVLVEELTKIFHGTFVLPLNLPGTKYRSALKAISVSLSPLWALESHIKFLFLFTGKKEGSEHPWRCS